MRTVGQAVRTMPDNLLNTVDEVFDGITRVFQNKNKGFDDPMKVGSSLHQEVSLNKYKKLFSFFLSAQMTLNRSISIETNLEVLLVVPPSQRTNDWGRPLEAVTP